MIELPDHVYFIRYISRKGGVSGGHHEVYISKAAAEQRIRILLEDGWSVDGLQVTKVPLATSLAEEVQYHLPRGFYIDD